uniref:Putative transmembrane protein n=1 Tax=Toxoplasma gondii COUG TaxID=1074873 RepID=A0A2G8XMJ8_TOXGO|nr:putative transmembrane protein [Toxoplasma gondii COUG]
MVNCTAIFSTMGIPGVLLVSLSLLAVSFPVCSGQENAYTFVNSKASSTFGPEFDALRAIQAGAGYWSSSGHHSGDEAGTSTTPTIPKTAVVETFFSQSLGQDSSRVQYT